LLNLTNIIFEIEGKEEIEEINYNFLFILDSFESYYGEKDL
jgi:hypothetical protein